MSALMRFIPLILLAIVGTLQAADHNTSLKPYILASTTTEPFSTTIDQTRSRLNKAGYRIAGEYSPYPASHIIAVTSDALRNNAGQTDRGGFGAAIRVAITQLEDHIQISYLNPVYMSSIYRLKGSLTDEDARLRKALGFMDEFGSKRGLSDFTLRRYHYMLFMPYFDDPLELAEFENQQQALETILANLNKGTVGTRLVYRVDIPGKAQTLLGVGIKDGPGSDASVMGITDTGSRKHSAHLPYEILVSDGKAYALHGKFRIAQSFPDLSLGTFMKISDAPGAIEQTLKALTQ